MSTTNNNSKQTYLFYIRKAPYNTALASGNIDIILTAAAFDQDVTVVFGDDGVYQLLKHQDSAKVGLKNVSQVFPALELYEVSKIFVEESALTERGLIMDDLVIPVELISAETLSDLMQSTAQVFIN